MFTVHIDMSGPLFDGRSDNIRGEMLRDLVWETAKEGRGDLGIQFIKVFKEPTGFYESRVEAVRPQAGPHPVAVIHDNGVVYGPWLEGHSSRNYPVTRFKGYHSFKIVTEGLRRKVPAIAERVMARHIQALNGGGA